MSAYLWAKKAKRLWYKNKYQYRHQDKDPLLVDFLTHAWPDAGQGFDQAPLLVVDLETTHLDPAKGEIASIGWVSIDNGQVTMKSADYYQIQLKQGVGQSAIYHQLRDDELSQGLKIIEVLNCFLQAAKGRVLVFHYAQLDMGFLNLLFRRVYGVPVVAPIVDTLLLEKAKYLHNNSMITAGVLRLFSCRQRYGLPDYPAHNALSDAIATAELLIAHVAHRDEKVKLKELF